MNLRIPLLLLCLIAPTATALAQVVPMLARPEPGIFRYFVWGVSPSDVREFESARYYKEEGGSLYFVELPPARSEFDVQFRRLIRYDFRDGRLWRAAYDYQDLTLSEPAKILDMYEDEKRALAARYGEPTRDEYLWKAKTYFQYPEFWGRALLSGDLRRETEWKLADGSIVLLDLRRDDPYYRLGYTVTEPEAADQSVPAPFLTTPAPSASILPAAPALR